MYIATDSGVSSSQRLIWGDMHDSLRYIVDIAGGTEARYAVNALASDDLGNLWMGTAGGGVKRVHSGEKIVGWRTYRYPTIPDDIINTMAADPHPLGEIWIGTPLFGLGRFTPSSTSPFEGTWKSYPSLEVPELGTNQMRSSAFNPQDSSFWFSSLLAVVSFTKSSQWKVFYLPNQYRLTVFGITFDRSNTVWLAQEEGATSFREPNVWGRYTYESTGGILPRGKVNAVLTDGRNIRWFGTNAGLARLRDTTWTLFSSISVPEFASDTITALAYDKRYNLWIGTTNGVLVYNDAGITF
jgi:ligand-binding sensor domain-containing protein